MVTRPEPQPDADDAKFWAAAADGRILLNRCRQCGRCWLRATPGCPRCGLVDIDLVEASGSGSLYSWVVVHRALDDSFTDDVPYAIVVVDLDEGARVLARMLDNSVALAAGMRLAVVPFRAGDWGLLGADVGTLA